MNGDLILNGGTGGTSAIGGCITITGGVSYGAPDDYSNCVGTYLGEDLKDPSSFRNSWDNIESALRGTPTARKYIDNDSKKNNETFIINDNGALAQITFASGGNDVQDELDVHAERLDDFDCQLENISMRFIDIEQGGFEDGYASVPSIKFDNEYGLGMFRKGYGEIGFSIQGGEVGSIDAKGIHFENIDILENRISQLENELMELRAGT